MQYFLVILVAGGAFGLCFLIDKAFTKAFRSKAQHLSGTAVRASKRYGVFGIVLSVLGIFSLCSGISQGSGLMLFCGIFVLLMGLAMAVYYLSFGIFYDEDSFLVSRLGRKQKVCSWGDIQGQQLYLLQGGNILVELYLADGTTLNIQSNMDGAYPFLDAAFAGWCRQTGRDPEACDFHDPSKSLWFPTVEG